MVDDARASLLATLAADRERRQQLDTAPDSAAKRKQDRDALIERLLQERRERQERQQALPPSAADGAAPAAPRAAPPRMAWEENLDRNELRLEHELGLPSTRWGMPSSGQDMPSSDQSSSHGQKHQICSETGRRASVWCDIRTILILPGLRSLWDASRAPKRPKMVR